MQVWTARLQTNIGYLEKATKLPIKNKAGQRKKSTNKDFTISAFSLSDAGALAVI